MKPPKVMDVDGLVLASFGLTANDRKTAQVISPITEVFGAKPFEKSFLGSSLWSRGKGKSKMYQISLDLDSNDTEAKIVMKEQGIYGNVLAKGR